MHTKNPKAGNVFLIIFLVILEGFLTKSFSPPKYVTSMNLTCEQINSTWKIQATSKYFNTSTET